jgi:hypothetical protein
LPLLLLLGMHGSQSQRNTPVAACCLPAVLLSCTVLSTACPCTLAGFLLLLLLLLAAAAAAACCCCCCCCCCCGLLQQVCVQHFGDYTRARVSPASLLPTSVVLEQRLWLGLLTRKPSRLVSTYRLSLKEFITFCKVRPAEVG